MICFKLFFTKINLIEIRESSKVLPPLKVHKPSYCINKLFIEPLETEKVLINKSQFCR